MYRLIREFSDPFQKKKNSHLHDLSIGAQNCMELPLGCNSCPAI